MRTLKFNATILPMIRRIVVAAGIVMVLLISGCGAEQGPSSPDDPTIVAARDAARKHMDTELAALPSAIPDPQQFARVEVDTCREGSSNWKIKEPFYTECRLQVAASFAFAGDFRGRAHALDTQIAGRGWMARMGIPSSIERWDGEDQSIGGLPSSFYERGDTGVQAQSVQRLWIVFGSTETPGDWPSNGGHKLATAEAVAGARGEYGVYHATTTGTPWGQAWHEARRPGPLVLVLFFDFIYFRDFRE